MQFPRRTRDWVSVIIGGIIEYNQQPFAKVSGTNLSQQLRDPLGITRLPALQTDQAMVVGRISPKDIEAIPARVGLELHRSATLDPSLTRNRCVEEVSGIEKIDFPSAR
jgi:hypothetical protein